MKQADFMALHGKAIKAMLTRGAALGYGQDAVREHVVARDTYENGTIYHTVWSSRLEELRYPDGKTELFFRQGDWEWRDGWYGGEPYSGMTILRLSGHTVFTMTYWGRVMEYVSDKRCVKAYECLRAALAEVDHERPWRGPSCYIHDKDTTYVHQWQGDLARFSGEEWINMALPADIEGPQCCKGQGKVYEMHYYGGLVDLREPPQDDESEPPEDD